MHKKILWLLIVLWTCITSITQWYTIDENCYTYWWNNYNCVELNINEEITYGDWTTKIWNSFNFENSKNQLPTLYTEATLIQDQTYTTHNYSFFTNSWFTTITRVIYSNYGTNPIATRVLEYTNQTFCAWNINWKNCIRTTPTLNYQWIQEYIEWKTVVKYTMSTPTWYWNNATMPYYNMTICAIFNDDSYLCTNIITQYQWNPANRLWATRTNVNTNIPTEWPEYIQQYNPITPFNWNSWTTNEEEKPACTNIQTQIMLYWYKYNTWLCYSNDKEWSWTLYTWERVTVTPKSIFEIFTWFDEYKTRRSIYENSCHAPYTQEYCLSRMQGNIYASEIFTKIDNAWLQADKIYQYCYLQLNFTEEEKRSTTNCEALDDWTYYAPWIEKGDWTPNPIEWLTDLIQDSAWYLPLPQNWSVFDEILPEWILSREDVALDLNFMKNMVNWARKFMILFTFRKDQPWIIPPYITSLILLFIFYKMLKK